MSEIDEMVENFKDVKGQMEIDDVAAALLVLSKMVRNAPGDDMLGHQLCLGIRKGLFGVNAGSDSSILFSSFQSAPKRPDNGPDLDTDNEPEEEPDPYDADEAYDRQVNQEAYEKEMAKD